MKNDPNVIDLFYVQIRSLRSSVDTSRLSIKLPIDNCISLYSTQRVKILNETDYIWHGKIINNSRLTESIPYNCYEGDASFIVKRGKTTGSIRSNENLYQLISIDNTYGILMKKNYSSDIVTCGNTEYTNGSYPVVYRNDYNCPIHVLALYTNKAKSSANGNIEDLIELTIDQANNAYNNSDIESLETRFIIADIQEINFVETNSASTDKENLIIDDNIQQIKDDVDADLVIIYTDGNYGAVLGTSGTLWVEESRMYCLVQVKCLPELLIPGHEMSHLLGCRHEWLDDNTAGTPFQHASKFLLGDWPFAPVKKTLMHTNAGNNTISQLSNPQVFYYGFPTGQFDENNARQVRDASCLVADFEPDPVLAFTGHLSAPSIVCVDEDIPAQAIVSGGPLGNYTFNWSYSYDGFNFASLGNSDEVFVPTLNYPPTYQGTYPVFIKIIITDLSGTSIILYKTVEVTNYRPPGIENPCSH